MDMGNVIMMSGTSLTLPSRHSLIHSHQIPIGSVSIFLFITRRAEDGYKRSPKLDSFPSQFFAIVVW
ncbi:hypothetical protein EGC78_11585 [Shewanella frigidimarina]|nr:hypothetical protein EGC78_11585 [Shewanella frigidimarina]